MEVEKLYQGVNELMKRRGYKPLTEDEFIEQISLQVAEGKLTVTNGEVKANDTN